MDDEEVLTGRTGGRSIRVTVWGVDAVALEEAALKAARECFGEDAALELDRSYQVDDYKHRGESERFGAAITVREVAPAPSGLE